MSDSLIAAAKDAIISIDEAQNIVLFNPAAEAIFRCAAHEALGQVLDRFIPEAVRAVHRRHIENFGAQGDATHAMGGGDRILTGVRADGEVFPIDASVSRSESAEGKRFTVILRDVTQRERDREALQRYADLVESSSDAIISRARDGTILTWNAAAAQIFGYQREEALRMNISDLFSPNTPPEHRDLAERAIAGKPIVNFETIRRRKDGSDIHVALTISVIHDREGKISGTSSIYRDITQRKRMERELLASLSQQKQAETALRESRDSLRELSSALQSIREEEKTRIARELHDELGQALTALKMDASAIADELLPAQTTAAKRTQDMKQLIDVTVRAVRRIATDLRPVMLDNLGLVPTLEWLTRDFSARSGIAVELAIPDEDLGASGDAATAVFRIVQEALTNVARHAQASRVRVEVLRRAEHVYLRVSDDGIGLGNKSGESSDPRESGKRKAQSHGVLGMRERAYVLGGSFTIASNPGAGATIEATIPAAANRRGQTP